MSRPGTGLGGGLSRPGTGRIWTVEGDDALEDKGDDVKSMSPTGVGLAYTTYTVAMVEIRQDILIGGALLYWHHYAITTH